MSRRAVAHQPFSSLCYAPFVSMYFDVRGNVIACCQNTSNVLGNVNETPLLDIWRGEAATAMRTTLAAGDFASGCDFCEWQMTHAGDGRVFAELFDEHQVRPDGDWPVLLEFATSNRCNLECIMCNGDFSSTIRARREHRPPLTSQYPDGFFEQLRPFLRHIEVVRFLGGEPFVVPDYQRIWDLMAEEGSSAISNVTTNGTVRTARVEATLDALPFSIGVSVDGITRTTIESIRKGADFDALMANIAWFRRYCRRRKTGFALTYCLMVPNHREFLDFLRFADDLDADVSVNTVVYPPAVSLYRLTPRDLRSVLSSLEVQDREARSLGRNRSVWEDELARLQAWASTTGARHAENAPPNEFFERWGPPVGATSVTIRDC